MKQISIRGARMHNLANISLDLPRNKLIVITGLSGSGKSSLAFDTIYAEGQRRYVESLSAYARQFLSLMEKPDVDHIEGLSPAISIEQKSTSHNPRSTVGTVTEIHDYLRLLFARIGEPRCPQHDLPLKAQTVSQMVDQVMAMGDGERLLLLAPIIQERKGEHIQVIEQLRAQGFIRARIDGKVLELDTAPELIKNNKHTIEAVVDRLVVRDGIEQRLAESFETALSLSDGLVHVLTQPREGKAAQYVFSARYACPECGYSLSELEPRLFSFNNPAGACPGCDGLGVRQLFDANRIIRDPGLSLATGAIAGWDRRNGFYFNLLTNLSKHYGFSFDTAFEDLPKKIQKVILFGSGNEKITFHYKSMRGQSRTHAFEGVIPNMERRYKETESHAVRDELARYLSVHTCEHCNGSRLREEARHVFIGDMAIHDISALPIDETVDYFRKLKLEGSRAEIAHRITQEITERLGFLANVGLGYLSLSRSAETLSGGEAQRIRLASQIGSALVGVMYVLDEPSIGLHQRDNARLLATLEQLRDLGNTVIVVEHDEDAIRSADHVLDLGPGAGINGGHIVAEGTPEQILANPASVTGKYLSGELSIAVPSSRTPADENSQLVIRGATGNNLRSVDASIPVGLLTCITGVSGSGKSTLINDTLYPAVAVHLNGSSLEPAPHDAIEGLENLDKVIDIDQSPIGRTPRSNPATYTGLFTPIRELFANTQEARARGYKPGRFSFNVKGGRCEACQGDGMIKVEMHFLPDIYVPCDQCKGARYNRETLDVTYKGKSIQEVLQMSIEEAADFFQAVPVVKRKLDTLMDVGLGYICLGQSATTLSGGEAQRIKLSRELSKRGTGKTLYILDEPTTGLHFQDIELLLTVLHRLRDQGNTIIVIEHNLDVIKTADWIIDLGPEGGAGGGTIIASGTPEQVSKVADSYTGIYLKPLLKKARSQTAA
ncbi:MAG: excinuclease ABC subunit UvrA [Arenicellales bacterium]|jgi:excinuclease ABC subunit A